MRPLTLAFGAALAALAVSGAGASAQATPRLLADNDSAPAQLIFGRDTAGDGALLQDAQFLWSGRQYCFYDGGWRGPGFYWCGYNYRRGYGWGGPVGWHGWSRGGPGFHGGDRHGGDGARGFQGGGFHGAGDGHGGGGHPGGGGTMGGGHPGPGGGGGHEGGGHGGDDHHH